MLQVTALYVYPIKSCRGIALDSAQVEPRGLQFDRRFMLVGPEGRFLTQRQIPALALLRTAIDGATLIVSRPDGDTVSVPLRPDFGARAPVKIWRSELVADVADDRLNDWFAEFLGRPARLVYMADHQHRRVAANRATRRDDEVSFADGAPLLLASEESLADLNTRLRLPVSMRRFRPNIVVTAGSAFAEDRWQRIRIAGIELEVGWPCSRCTMTTVDPDTGKTDAAGQPLATLREFRHDGTGILFGQNLLTRGSGTVHVGDAIEVHG